MELLSKNVISDALRLNVNKRIIKSLEREIPWQKRWKGWGKGIGVPKNISGQKYFGINVILLQMSARTHEFTSNVWATPEQFLSLGGKIKSRPANVMPGSWATEVLIYRNDITTNKSFVTPSMVYNCNQLEVMLEDCRPEVKLYPKYDRALSVLHSTPAKIKNNDNKQAWYFYPPHDYITLPKKEVFEESIGGMPGYCEALAHELMHWTEPRLGVDEEEAVNELRAEIGSAILVEELDIPHSISYSNIDKWRAEWIDLMKKDANLIFRVSASACRAVDYILGFTNNVGERFNEVSENAA